jgi:hypothetical protein
MDAVTNPRRWSAAGRCSSQACAEVAEVPGGRRFTSTISDENMTYTTDEFRVFVQAAKDGELDHLL